MRRSTSFTRCPLALLLKVSTSVPAEFVVTVPTVVPLITSAPPSVSAPSVPVALKRSLALAPPLRTKVSVAPL